VRNLEAKDWIALGAGVGITVIAGASLYRYFKYGKQPGLASMVAIPALTAFMFYGMSPSPPPFAVALERVGLVPPALRGG